MSREFGEESGYMFFHGKIQSAKEDLEDASFDFHKKFIPLFEDLYEIAYAISSVEAGDSGEARSIIKTIQKIDSLRKNISNIEDSLRPYQDVMEQAVRDFKSEKG